MVQDVHIVHSTPSVSEPCLSVRHLSLFLDLFLHPFSRENFNGRIGERGARNWEEKRRGMGKKIQRQGGKCRGEEIDKMD
jgi:hypothetical protein